MTRHAVQIQTKFRQHNPAVLRLHARNGAAENIRVMPPKFWPDPNQSRHKHALSVTMLASTAFSSVVVLREKIMFFS
jgi:hypothetical protein